VKTSVYWEHLWNELLKIFQVSNENQPLNTCKLIRWDKLWMTRLMRLGNLLAVYSRWPLIQGDRKGRFDYVPTDHIFHFLTSLSWFVSISRYRSRNVVGSAIVRSKFNAFKTWISSFNTCEDWKLLSVRWHKVETWKIQ
jgi:hypothetical protein